MAGGGELQITLSGEAAQRLRQVSPRGSLNRLAEKVLMEWAEDVADSKAADAAELRSKGKPTVTLAQLKKECGL